MIEKAIEALNDALRRDPETMAAMFHLQARCNEALADHPTVQVTVLRPLKGHADSPGGRACTVGVIGLINGVVEPLTGKRIAAQWSDDIGDDGLQKLVGFCEYKPEQPDKQP